jgi:hypothetical protein
MRDWLAEVTSFANRFGWLGSWPVQVTVGEEPPDPTMMVHDEHGKPRFMRMGEFRLEWEDRVREVRDLFDLADAARRATAGEARAYEQLNERIEWARTDGVPFVSLDPNEVPTFPKEELVRAVFLMEGQEPEREWRVGACRVGYGRRSIFIHGWRDAHRSTIRPNKSTLVTAAQLAVSTAIADALRGMITIVPSVARHELTQEPDHLVGAIYLLLAQEVVGTVPRYRWRPCAYCGTQITGGRSDKRFCSDRCRYAASYAAGLRGSAP